MFIEKKLAKAKEEDKKLTFKDISKLWKGLTVEKKKQKANSPQKKLHPILHGRYLPRKKSAER